ncbi:uncharacterized protein BDV14DRAFT_198220 [Aspergillus stella-maris]|uniref:uncharacterized protein n=1 Tax=Aspergillus stella-maris TaxID=1810926 RepID=UPI003CCDAC96
MAWKPDVGIARAQKWYRELQKQHFAETLAPVIWYMDRLRVLQIKGSNFDNRFTRAANIDWYGERFFEREDRQQAKSAKFHDMFLRTASSPILANLRVCELSFNGKSSNKCWEISKRDSIFLHRTSND